MTHEPEDELDRTKRNLFEWERYLQILDMMEDDRSQPYIARKLGFKHASSVQNILNRFQGLEALIDRKVLEGRKITGETSDGYHTFNELYAYREAYNAALFNEWYEQGKYDVHKSWKHSDGELCFGGGWFIVMATLPTGQISNHYEAKHWDDFAIREADMAADYDGHTPQDALDRLTQLKANHSKGDV